MGLSNLGSSFHFDPFLSLAIGGERTLILAALILAVLALGVAIALLVVQKGKKPSGGKSAATAPAKSSITANPPSQGVKPQSSMTAAQDSKRPPTRSRTKRVVPSREEAVLAEDAGDFLRASSVWMMRGNRTAQLRALEKAGDEIAVADLKMALGWDSLAVPRLENLLSLQPKETAVRRRLFEAYVDMAEPERARQVASVIVEGAESQALSPKTLWEFGRGFELIGDRDAALKLYQEAARQPDCPSDLEVRSVYLSEMNRLQLPGSSSSGELIAREIIALELGDSSPSSPIVNAGTPGEMIEAELREAVGEPRQKESIKAKGNGEVIHHATPREVIVGHLALGGELGGTIYSVRSRASLASRYQFKRLVSDNHSAALFEGVDKLLDCPVAIKLSHISLPASDFELLRDRLRVISSINHPNLTKSTYVDREGNVVRVVTDFHSGGSLDSMLSRMEQIGLPLMIRLIMQVASGVHAAHSHGVLHGDLRAQNIMIGHDQLIKVSDFALQPFPVRRLKPDDSRGRDILQLFPSEEIQIDIKRFADLLDQLLKKTVVSSVLAGNFETGDPLEELAELARRAREGAFSSLTPIQKILQQVMEGIQPMGRSN
jgi:tRNA A-37 threonylcarbamoyl transferase component Bud32